jgi:glucose/arabinose dehydrogenase
MAAPRSYWRSCLAAMLALAIGACSGSPASERRTQAGPSPTQAQSVGGQTPTATTTAPTPARPPTREELARVAVRLVEVAKLDQPVALAVAADGQTFYVAERTARVRAMRDGRVQPRPALDLSAEVTTEGEGGLLGVAVAPDRRHLYATFTDRRRAVRLIEVALGADGPDPAHRRDLLTVAQPSVRHHGGNVVFGPGGMLWLGLGDGSEGGDPADAAQSLAVLRGKLVRLDPTLSGAAPYTVPATNPFVRRRGARPEIWALGLRNPWRFSFDRLTGELWIGDVGQYIVEEIDVVVPARTAGANFGWNRLEGKRRFKGSTPRDAVPPVHTYNHAEGRCAVVGGFVYRGAQIAGLRGVYVYGDVCDGRIRALVRTSSQGTLLRDLGVAVPRLVSFAEDAAGELYALSLAGGVYRLVAGSSQHAGADS